MTKPAPIKIRGVHHFAMSVPSLESAIAFYRDAFGFELVDHEHLGQSEEGDRVTQMKNTDTTLAMLHAGNIFIELFEFHSPQPGENTRRMCDYGPMDETLLVTSLKYSRCLTNAPMHSLNSAESELLALGTKSMTQRSFLGSTPK